jgi:membrane dipeptidase
LAPPPEPVYTRSTLDGTKVNRRDVLRAGLLAGAQAAFAPLLHLGSALRLAAAPLSPLAERDASRLTGPPHPPLSPPPPTSPELQFSSQAAGIVRATTVVDMLSLLTLDWQRLYEWQREPRSFGRAELARLQASGIAVFHPAVDPSAPDAPAAARRWMAGWNRLIDTHPQMLLRIDRAADLQRVKAEGRIGLVLGFQNSNHFRRPADVAEFHALGQRVSQLTYNERNRLGSGCTDPDAGGLSEFGGAIVAAMNRQGMAIDISHCGERTSLDALAASVKPVLVTHSNCRALVHHPRCKSDAVIRAMAAKGGVIGISVLPMMLSAGRAATLDDVLDQFDHVARLVGVEHVGLGSDTDVDAVDPRTHRTRSGYAVRGMRHADRVFELAEGLLRRGYAAADVAGILGGNFQRALTEIWSA